MPASDLKADIKANIAELETLLVRPSTTDGGMTEVEVTPRDIALHLKNSLWPFLDGVADHMAEYEAAFENAGDAIGDLEEAVDELTEQSGTVITKDDAGVLATLVLMAREVATQLEKGTTPAPDKVAALKIACDAVEKVIQENTIDVDLDDDEEGDDDGDDD